VILILFTTRTSLKLKEEMPPQWVSCSTRDVHLRNSHSMMEIVVACDTISYLTMTTSELESVTCVKCRPPTLP